MIKVVIFDFFDVIYTDSFKAWLRSKNLKLEGGYEAANIRMDRGLISVEQFIQELSDLCGDSPQKILADMDANAQLDHGVLEIIDSLRPKYQTALLSNAPSSFIRELFTAHDLERYFDEIVISSEVGLIKPHPEVFHHLLEKMNITADQALFIDDNPRNIEGAANVGIAGIVYTDADALRAELTVRLA